MDNSKKTKLNSEIILERLLSASILGVSVYVLLYYITGPALGFFHSDCTDSLLWSQISVDSGKILSEDFHYAAILPFGSSLWMIPILKIFGYTMTAQKVSMSVFALIFTLSAYSMVRALKWNRIPSSISALILSMLLSGSEKLREIMWEHTIYYSLGILFFMLLVNLTLRLSDYINLLSKDKFAKKDITPFVLLSLALLILSIGSGLDGFQMLVLSVIPVMSGYLAVTFFENEDSFSPVKLLIKAIPFLITAVGILAGLLFLSVITKDGKITADYENAFSIWKPINLWWGHIESFLQNYLSLFGINIIGGEPIFSVKSVFMLIKTVTGFIILVCPLLLLFSYKKIKNYSSKLIVWSHTFLTVILMLGYICGALSDANWRLTPMLGSSIITTLVYFYELWNKKDFEKKMAVILVLIIGITAGFNTYTVCKLPNTLGYNQTYIDIAEKLYSKGCTKGYATFWNAGNTTLLSDSKVKAVSIEVNANGIQKYSYQTSDSWFKDDDSVSSYFLLLSKEEFEQLSVTEYYKTLNDTNNQTDAWEYSNFVILIYSKNPLLGSF